MSQGVPVRIETVIFGEPETVRRVDTSESGWVWVCTDNGWRRLTRSEWAGAVLEATHCEML